jgi:hypothetical protein
MHVTFRSCYVRELSGELPNIVELVLFLDGLSIGLAPVRALRLLLSNRPPLYNLGVSTLHYISGGLLDSFDSTFTHPSLASL